LLKVNQIYFKNSYLQPCTGEKHQFIGHCLCKRQENGCPCICKPYTTQTYHWFSTAWIQSTTITWRYFV